MHLVMEKLVIELRRLRRRLGVVLQNGSGHRRLLFGPSKFSHNHIILEENIHREGE
jgi:hypothetical protein